MMRVDVSTLRHFNRSFSKRVGVLEERFLGRPRPLGHARLLFEIGPDGAAVRDLREDLGLDSGYVSRVLRALEADGLVEVETSPGDRRRRRAVLTAKGRSEWVAIDRRSDELAHRLLEPLTVPQRAQLEEALALAERLLRAATVHFDVVDPSDDEAVGALAKYFGELDQRFPAGFDGQAALSESADPYRPPSGRFVVARSDGDVVGCGGVLTLEPTVGEIKRMWIDRSLRGLALGRRLLTTLEAHARELGHERVRLDTNAILETALAMYRQHGYVAIERYNDNPDAQHWFEKRLDTP